MQSSHGVIPAPRCRGRRRAPFLASASVLLVLAGNAEAAGAGTDEPAWYLELGAGLVLPQQGKGTDRNPGDGTQVNPPTLTEFAVNYGRGLFGSIAAGRREDGTRLELEIKVLDNGIGDPGAAQLGADRQGALAVMGNAWFEFGTWAIRPYVGGGAGVVRKTISGARDDSYAGQLGVGADWNVAGRWTLTGGYRYLDTAPMKFERATHELSSTFRAQILSLGVRYTFTPEPAPPPAAPQVEVVPVVPVVPIEPAPQIAPVIAPEATPERVPPPPCRTPEPGERVSLSGCGTGDKIVLQGVHFQFNKAALTTDARGILEDVAAELLRYPDLVVEISGHTDSLGSDGYNQRLSAARANSVMEFLIGKGIPSTRISAVGLGETAPIADNGTESGREQNRRVELRIAAGAATVTGAALSGVPPDAPTP